MAEFGPRRAGPRGPSVLQRLQALQGLNADAPDLQAFFRDMPEMEAEELSIVAFRHHSPGTQYRQNYILEGYYAFIKAWYWAEFSQDPPPSAEILDGRAFPSELDACGRPRQLIKFLNLYLTYSIDNALPRSLKDHTVGYSCMAGYRAALLFWVNYKFKNRQQQPPSRNTIWNALTENMRKLASDHNMKFFCKASHKSHVGLSELMQLIDWDMRGSPCISLAECHHLAWLLARFCAIRPGSLGQPPNKSLEGEKVNPFPFLKFGDFVILRNDTAGQFDLKMTIRNLKGKPQQLAETTGFHSKSVTFIIKSPQNQHNLMLSVTHRFLVLALRRGALQDYTTIEELLLKDKRRYIHIKPEFLDRPVLCAGTARGLDIILDEPVRTGKLTEYLSLRGRKSGYEENITFYSIRRRAGTDFAKVLGPDGTRSLMCHDPDSRTLERFYLDMLSTTDVAALGLGESMEGRRKEMQLQADCLALNKLPQDVCDRFGREVNALVRQAIVVDEPHRACTSKKAAKNRERQLRRIAVKEFIANAHKLQKEHITTRDFEARGDALLRKATKWNKCLIEQIRMASNTPASPQPREESVELGDDDPQCDDEFPERSDENDGPEDDIDDQLAGDGEGPEAEVAEEPEVQTVEEQAYSRDLQDYVTLLDDVPYLDAVRSTMELLMNNGFSEYRQQESSECPLCLDDDSIIDPAVKHKAWQPAHIHRHMASRIHAPVQVLMRTIKNENDSHASETQGMLPCPFCTEIAPLESLEIPTYKAPSRLIEHWRRSTSGRIHSAEWTTPALAEMHEGLKAAAGFFDPDFNGDTTVRDKENKVRKQKVLRDFGDEHPSFQYSTAQALDIAVPYPANRRIYMGKVMSNPGIQSTAIVLGPMPSTYSNAQRWNIQSVNLTAIPSVAKQKPQIHPEDAHLVKVVSLPGRPGNRIGDGNRYRDTMDITRLRIEKETEARHSVKTKRLRMRQDNEDLGGPQQKKAKQF